MPLIKREIEPVYISRSVNLEVIPKGVPELECLTNVTLSSLIRQLSNLARHAEDLFGELYNEANSMHQKSCMLQERIDVLSVKVTQLDAINDKGRCPLQRRWGFMGKEFLCDDGAIAATVLLPRFW